MHETEWEEGQYLETLEEMEADCLKMVTLLREVASCDFSKRYRRDIPRFVDEVKKLAERCREERESFGLWREDELEPAEIIEKLDAEFGPVLAMLKPAFDP